MSLDRMIAGIIQKQNPSVAGLDPKLSYIPNYIKETSYKKHGKTLEAAADAILEYNIGLIDALYEIVPAIKPQSAYYEMYGWQGMQAMHDTIAYAKEKGMFVITDGKRNDIGTTMESYAIAHIGTVEVEGVHYEPFKGDSLTVNGYLGSDGIDPLLHLCDVEDKGIFVLVKTSNESSGELQNLILENKQTVYRTMGDMCEKWGASHMGKYGYSAVGAVVGATYPQELKELRKALPHTFFLVPGYGAQGGGADDIVSGFDEKGLGAIISSSRGIICAWQKNGYNERDYAKAAAEEAIRMRDEIIARIGKIG